MLKIAILILAGAFAVLSMWLQTEEQKTKQFVFSFIISLLLFVIVGLIA